MNEREFSLRALILGVVIGAVLAMANAYVGLKVGMTVSASIPAAVISMGIMRMFMRQGSLLENNLVQTVGSAGESLAAGMIFTIPALMLMGFDVAYADMILWAAVGGLLGVALMVPLRRVLIVKEHGKLTYPEGVACAKVLQSRESGGAGKVFWGLGVAGIYEIARRLGGWRNNVDWPVVAPRADYKTGISLDASPALLGVGYILGPRVAGYILGGAFLGWFLLIPAIAHFGADDPDFAFPVPPEFNLFADDAASNELRHSLYERASFLHQEYIRYIGAGAVAAGGLISLIKSGGTIFSSILSLLGGFLTRGRAKDGADRDIPILLLMLVVIGLVYAMWRLPQIHTGPVGAVVTLVAAFFFVTVSSRLVGIVGASSNPISGMTIATLLGASIIFFHTMGASDASKFAALSVGAIVCVAISVAGDCSQDLKTGFLVKATPWKQQVGEMIGVLTSCAAIAFVIKLLYQQYGLGEPTEEHPYPLMAPQAQIMRFIVEGVMEGGLPWFLIALGAVLAVMLELLFGLPALPVAVGLYLPLGLSTPIMVGGLARGLVNFRHRHANHEEATDGGVLTASGFVAAEGLVGIAMAGLTAALAYFGNNPTFQSPAMDNPEPFVPNHVAPWLWNKLGWEGWYGWGLTGWAFDLLPLAPFALLVLWMTLSGLRELHVPPSELEVAGTPVESAPRRSGFSMLPTPAEKPKDAREE